MHFNHPIFDKVIRFFFADLAANLMPTAKENYNVLFLKKLRRRGVCDDIGLTIVSSEIRLYGFKESCKPRNEWSRPSGARSGCILVPVSWNTSGDIITSHLKKVFWPNIFDEGVSQIAGEYVTDHWRDYLNREIVSIQKLLFSPISLLGGNFNPLNINHMPAVKISARLELDETISFLDGH